MIDTMIRIVCAQIRIVGKMMQFSKIDFQTVCGRGNRESVSYIISIDQSRLSSKNHNVVTIFNYFNYTTIICFQNNHNMVITQSCYG